MCKFNQNKKNKSLPFLAKPINSMEINSQKQVNWIKLFSLIYKNYSVLQITRFLPQKGDYMAVFISQMLK